MRRDRQKDNSCAHILAKSYTALGEDVLAECLAPFGIRPSPPLARAIRCYLELLLRWNAKVSLTSIRDPREILVRHFGESMFAAQAIPFSPGRLIDIGSGAGFPGLALKLVVPELDVTLIEANLKKAAFLSEVIRLLELRDVRVLAKRMELLQDIQEAADYVTSRAVRPDKQMLAFCRRTLGPAGRVIFWLSAEDASRLSKTAGWHWQKPISVPLSKNRVLLCGVPSTE